MKGLLIKDLKILKNQKYFLLIMVVICGGFLVKGGEIGFVFSYAGMMCSVLVMSTISYDEYDNGMGYLLTFPIRRKDYVLEKYVFGILMTFFVFAVMGISTVLLSAANHTVYEEGELLFTILVSIMVIVLMQSFIIPIQLKFGSEKSRMAMLLIVVIAVSFGYAVMYVGKLLQIDPSKITEYFVQLSPAALIACSCVLVTVLLAISYRVSLAVMNRKQF